jgi:hypothetical protein
VLHFFIYSTNIRSEYFKHAAHSPFFPLKNAVYFIKLPFLVPVFFTFYIQDVLKFKRKFRRQRVKEIRLGRAWDSAGYGTVADSSEGSTELLLVSKGSRFPHLELNTLLHIYLKFVWGT